LIFEEESLNKELKALPNKGEPKHLMLSFAPLLLVFMIFLPVFLQTFIPGAHEYIKIECTHQGNGKKREKDPHDPAVY
jgi:hypothetical protein